MSRLQLLYPAAIALSLSMLPSAVADNIPIIANGKVTMKDGTPPPKSVGLERICTDNGSGPGPLTNKKGEYTWRMEVDPMRTRRCFIRATSPEYTSSQIDISALNGYLSTVITLDTIVLSPKTLDPSAITVQPAEVPKALGTWKDAMAKAAAGDLPGAEQQVVKVMQEAPKWAAGWHALGVMQLYQMKNSEARDSFEKSIAADKKYLQSYVMLTRIAIRVKDWDGASKYADALMAVDKKTTYEEMLLHVSVAKYQMKDLAGAETLARQAIDPKMQGKVPRAEYVLGRILAAKGDFAGAREHMAQYLRMEPDASDKAAIQAFMLVVEKAGAVPEPDLEVI